MVCKILFGGKTEIQKILFLPNEMNVHLFGASYSPSFSNFALNKAAEDNETLFGKNARLSLNVISTQMIF